MPPPLETASTSPGPGWGAYVAAAAGGLLVIATGVSWFGGGLWVDAFDIPFATLFSDTAAGGLPLGAVLVLPPVAALATALIAPSGRALPWSLLSAGALAVLLMGWWVIRVISTSQGAPLLDVLSWGPWLGVLASLGMLLGGIALAVAGPRPGQQPA